MTDRDAGYREGIEAELLPCPFCGNKNIRICSNGIGDFYAICTGEDDEPHCGASCSEINCETEAKAVRRWNTRALPLPSTPDDGKAEAGAIACWRYRNELDEIVSEWIDGVPPKYLRDVQTGGRVDITDLKIDVAYTRPSPSPASDGAIREAIKEACDLLAERKYGNPARSPGHNARLVLERALSAHQADEDSEGKNG